MVLCSFSLLWGPVNHLKHLLSAERLPFTVSYFGTMGATLYFALSVSTFITPHYALFSTEFEEVLSFRCCYALHLYCKLVGKWKLHGGLVVGHRTCDLVVAGSRPGRDAAA